MSTIKGNRGTKAILEERNIRKQLLLLANRVALNSGPYDGFLFYHIALIF